MSATLPTRVTFAESVRLRLGAERGFLFDQRTGRVFSLNASGAFAAERLLATGDPSAVLDTVVAEFEAEIGPARDDLARLLGQLADEGLVITHG